MTVTGRSLSTLAWRSTLSNVSSAVIDHRTKDRVNHKTHTKVNTAGAFRNDRLTRPGSDSDRATTKILAPFTTQDANSTGTFLLRALSETFEKSADKTTSGNAAPTDATSRLAAEQTDSFLLQVPHIHTKNYTTNFCQKSFDHRSKLKC